jgi:hypothetical protein
MATLQQQPLVPGNGAADDKLKSWRQIAGYLNRGVRTVQRWNLYAGLPVHRVGPARTPVVAFRSEIDAWLHSKPTRQARTERVPN